MNEPSRYRADADPAAISAAAQNGMLIAYHAARAPERRAIWSHYGTRTFGELNANANRLARALANAGIGPGDAVAIVMRNRPEFIETLAATARTGIRFTPINFHLTGEEIGYIVDNCEARAFIADAGLGPHPADALQHAPGVKLALAVGGAIEGFTDYASTLSGFDAGDIADPQLGSRMLYTSGTTGRPKGVYRNVRIPEMPQWQGSLANYQPETDTELLTGPAYHAAPLLIDIVQPLNSGIGIVMMDKWDAVECLELIEEHSITHTHMVATMFHRLLQLPETTRSKFNPGSLRLLIHGAAPCPVHIKKAMIEWFGPIVWEYYAATEGGGGFIVGSEEWLKKPGTVGKPGPEFDNKILNDEGAPAAPGEVGTIYMRAPDVGRFEYYKDADKTGRTYLGDYFTLGDMGYFDEDGYLFLTGRTAELIISGGVNIYPQEIDSVLMTHPAIYDVCTVGVPNDEWGEEVKSVIQLNAGYRGDEALARELIAFARTKLAAFKCPRSIDFISDLPRSAAGKVQRKTVRDQYL